MEDNKLIDSFSEWLMDEGKTDNTIKSYTKVVHYFETWYITQHGSTPDYLKIQPVDLREWKQYLIRDAVKRNGEPLSIKTVNNYIESLKTFFLFLLNTKVIMYNPMEKIKPQVLKTEYTPRWLDSKEKRLVVKYVEDLHLKNKNPWRSARNKFIIYVMLHGGLRISEVLNLSIYDFKDGYLKIREGKGQAAREVPMNRSLTVALDEWLKERNIRNKNDCQNKFLILSQKGGKLTESGIYSLFERIAAETGIEEISPHTLRHTFANDLLEKGHPITYVATLLGHNDLDSTRIYTSPKRKNLKDAVETLSDED